MSNAPVIVHVTHETVQKIGGIGAVLKGFFTCPAYLNFTGRSIITGPVFERDLPVSKRLGDDGHLLFSSADGVANTEYAPVFSELENIYNARIIYGTRTFTDEQTCIQSDPEVILVDVTRMHPEPVNELKNALFEHFGIESNRHEHIWEYEQYIRLAAIVPSILKVMGLGSDTIIAAHEWMGMPTALSAMCDRYADFRTVFYAHEVATIRKIIEEHPGHDTAFYSVLRYAHNNNRYLIDIFGDQSEYFKHQLVEASQYCHAICAVGDYAAKELRFLSAGFSNHPVEVVYNGVPAYESGLQQKTDSKEKLRQYCRNILGFKPDYIFTHVTRLVVSKGLWRDLQILENIDKQFVSEGKTAVLFVLSTEVGRKTTEQVQIMESAYGWPVAHKEGWPDLSGGETKFHFLVQRFNARSRNVKAVFINQFGFDPASCGRSMPQDMKFEDIRRGSDVEFGLSTYEPFGISHLEPLTYGGICVLSSICGCAGFIKKITENNIPENIIIADYTQSDIPDSEYKNIERTALKRVETIKGRELAEEILKRLNKNSEMAIEQLIRSGYDLASKMSWQRIISDFVLPALKQALSSTLKKLPAW